MKSKNRILSMLLILVMMIGVLVPVGVFALPVPQDRTDVVIHKMLLNDLTGWPKPTNPDGTQPGLAGNYDGSEIQNIEGYFGQGATELAGVNFTYWSITEAQYNEMTETPKNYDTVEKVKAYLNNAAGTVVGPTTTSGLTITGLTKGHYWFVENGDANIQGGATISGSAAVPFGLQLPVYKADGSKFTTGDNALHVYPKNTTSDKPDVDKDIEGHEDDETLNPIDYTVGSQVPYVITTTVKAGTQYKTAEWFDKMTEGLTFAQTDLDAMEITIGGQAADSNDYTKTLDGNGFKVVLNQSGLDKINGKDADVVVTIKYKATLNENALVEIPESNDVTFHYGNNPNHGNTPIPNKPNENGEITMTKTWAQGTDVPANATVTFTLYNAQTGKVVTAADVTAVTGYTFENPVTLNATANMTHTWKGLDKDTQYKVVESNITGYSAEYQKGEAGNITITNHKDGNPPPVNPETPKVVTGGKRFQKIDPKLEEGKQGLVGAEFLVKNGEGKWLKAKDASQLAADQTTYQEAEKAYQDARKAGKTGDELAALKKTRDDAYRTVKTTWEWIDAADKKAAVTKGAYKVTSGVDGYFKVTGLAYGNYNLVEVKAPQGYAEITEDIPFEVAENSLDNTDGILQKVENKKITIPQTGGIGTAIFAVAGIALMGGAFIAMRKNTAEEQV